MLKRLTFDLRYRLTKPPWDSGVTPPEVVAAVASGGLSGRALDLGCGTGTNSIYLAQHGFAVVGVDFSAKAIATAREKAKRAGAAVNFHIADVTRLDFLKEPFDYILDIGCFHAIDFSGQARYAENLARLTHAGSLFMLYSFSPRPADSGSHVLQLGSPGVTEEQVKLLFCRNFELVRAENGADRGSRRSAWHWFRRIAG